MSDKNKPIVDHAKTQKIRQLQEQVEELSFLQRLERELTWVLDPNHVLNITMDWAMRRTAADTGLIAIRYDNVLRVVRLVGAEPQESQRLMRESFPIGLGVISQVIKDGVEQIHHNLEKDSEMRAIISPKAQSILTYPLKARREIVGVLHLESTEGNHFTNDMVEFIAEVTARAGVALRNAHIYDQTHNAEQLKSDMIRMAAHDLRTPLNTIRTGLHIIDSQSRHDLPQASRLSLDSIAKSANHMTMLLEELLVLERLETGEISNKPVDLLATLQDSLERVQNVIEGKEHQLVLNTTATEPIYIMGEPTFYRQAMINLLSNAAKYTPAGGQITVRLEAHGKKAFFDVKDNGYGISEERQQKLFQRFYRAYEPTTTHIEGTGLGLSLVKTIVERAEGEVWFESEVDKGSTFGFWLPLAENVNIEHIEVKPENPLKISYALERRRARERGQSFQ